MSTHFWPASTLLHGHIALAIPSLLETDPQILEDWCYVDEDYPDKHSKRWVLDDFRSLCCMREFGDGFDGEFFPRLSISWRKPAIVSFHTLPVGFPMPTISKILCTRCLFPDS